MREKLGWFFGKGLRTGDGQNCRYISHMESSMSVGINNPGHPGYVIGVLTLPNVPTFANWGGDDDSIYNNSMPADKDWESLDFLNPLWSVIDLDRSVGGANLESWRRWSIQQSKLGGSDTQIFKPAVLNLLVEYSSTFRRAVTQPSTITPS